MYCCAQHTGVSNRELKELRTVLFCAIPASVAKRTALLIRCSGEDAASIRQRAAAEHRTIAGYLLHVVDRMIKLDDKFASKIPKNLPLPSFDTNATASAARDSAILLRCSIEEARRIRSAAKRRATTISGLVIHYLRVSWDAASGNNLLMDDNLAK